MGASRAACGLPSVRTLEDITTLPAINALLFSAPGLLLKPAVACDSGPLTRPQARSSTNVGPWTLVSTPSPAESRPAARRLRPKAVVTGPVHEAAEAQAAVPTSWRRASITRNHPTSRFEFSMVGDARSRSTSLVAMPFTATNPDA